MGERRRNFDLYPNIICARVIAIFCITTDGATVSSLSVDGEHFSHYKNNHIAREKAQQMFEPIEYVYTLS